MSTDKPPNLEPVECTSSEKRDELTTALVLQDEEQKQKQVEELSGVHERGTSSHDFHESESMHGLSTIMMSDVYSLESDKFGHELMHLIESGQSLENWQHHGYSQAETESFPHTTHIDPCSSMQPCNSDMQSTSESSVTLTVLNSTNTDEAAHSMPFPYVPQPVKHSINLDHDYFAYRSHKQENPVMAECLQMDDSSHDMQEQNEMPMDREKLQRMKRRKEKNRECSRQFRLKQKDKEQRLTLGKVEKNKMLDNTKRNVQKLKAILSKVSQKCSSCPTAAMLLNQYVTGSDKENINPNFA